MAHSLTWVLPSLGSALRGEQGEGWARWLGRARRLPDAGFGARQAFADALAVPVQQLPWATACAGMDFADAQSYAWVRADPIQTLVDRFSLRLMRVGDAGLDQTLQLALIEVINEWLDTDGWQLRCGPMQRWYLCGATTDDPACLPPDGLLGLDLAEALPAAGLWRRRLNDVQVLLTQHPPLQQRRAQGLACIDSLWFWGGAAPGSCPSPQVDWVDADEQEFAALAALLGCARTSGQGRGVVEGPQTTPSTLAPALRKGPLKLNFASGERFELKPVDRWRWWSRPFQEPQ